MTRSEIHKKLNNTKVYLGKHSEEVQKKLFELGYSWGRGVTDVSYTDKPFLFISTYCDFLLGYSDNLKDFNEDRAKEITVEDILGIEEDVNTSFKNKQELLEEMAKHSPYGWITNGCRTGQMISCDDQGFTIIEHLRLMFIRYEDVDKYYGNLTFMDRDPFKLSD